ncbi:hypothetical protein [Maribacter litoralis]|uniref:hypothetical protein n=1 Tax=Maribacter litoralis TaxID=2059726 RepID=UPI003F5CF382
MSDEKIKELINGIEPIAIVRYFEWAVFSNDYANPKYLLLRINITYKDIYEIDIPEKMVSFLVSELDGFEEVFHRNDGVVWERMAFRDKVKEIVPMAKIVQLINQ